MPATERLGNSLRRTAKLFTESRLLHEPQVGASSLLRLRFEAQRVHLRRRPMHGHEPGASGVYVFQHCDNTGEFAMPLLPLAVARLNEPFQQLRHRLPTLST